MLFGTGNPAKIRLTEEKLKPLPLKILNLNDFEIDIDVEETGSTVEENALIKAKAYFHAAQFPTFAIDVGITIQKFPVYKQPGVFEFISDH